MVKPEHGAPLVPQPVARTPEEAASPEFQLRLKGAAAKQRIANETARGRSTSTVSRAPPSSAITEGEQGAAAAQALISGEGMASSPMAIPAGCQMVGHSADELRMRGAAAATELIGTPEQQRANRAAQASGLSAGGSDAAAGAAEARRLLCKE